MNRDDETSDDIRRRPRCPPTFECNFEHNRTTNCSLIKMCDILEATSSSRNASLNSENRNRSKLTILEQLMDAFSYLPSSDLKCLIVQNDASEYLRECYQVPDIEMEASIALFRHVEISLVQNPESVIDSDTLSVLFRFAKKNINELRNSARHETSSVTISANKRSSSSSPHIVREANIDCTQNIYIDFRQSISDFLNFLKRFIFIITDNDNNAKSGPSTDGNLVVTPRCNLQQFQLCSIVLKELKSLLIFVGRLSQFRRYFWKTNNCSTATTAATYGGGYHQDVPFQLAADRRRALYNYYHVALEIWWATIEIAFRIQSATRYRFNDISILFGDDNSTTIDGEESSANFDQESKSIKSNSYQRLANIPLFTQATTIIAYDLLMLGSGFSSHFERSFAPPLDYHHQSPFVCTCAWEVFIGLRILLPDHRPHTDIVISLDPFYDFLFRVTELFFENRNKSTNEKVEDYSQIIDDHQDDDANFDLTEFHFEHFESITLPRMTISKVGNFRLFQAWIFANFAPILSIDLAGDNRLRIESYLVATPPALIKLYRIALRSDCDLESEQTRHFVANLLLFSHQNLRYFDRENFDSLLLFVEYFLRKLNQNYATRTRSANNVCDDYYCWMPKSGADWLAFIRSLAEHVTHYRAFEIRELNIFQLFLALLVSQLERFFTATTANSADSADIIKIQNLNFQKFISKIVVSLQPRSLRALQPIGVFNLCSFYLALIGAISIDRWREIVDKVLFVFNEIARNITTNTATISTTTISASLPHQSSGSINTINELLIRFYFAILRRTTIDQSNESNESNEDDDRAIEINRKIAAQLAKHFERFQAQNKSSPINGSRSSGSSPISRFTDSTNHRNSFAQIYFDELNEFAIERLRRVSTPDRHLLRLLDSLLLKLDFAAICSISPRSRNEPIERIIAESIDRVAQFLIQFFRHNNNGEDNADNDNQLNGLEKHENITMSSSCAKAPRKISKTQLDHETLLEEFGEQIIEKTKEIIQYESKTNSLDMNEDDEGMIANVSFNATLLHVLIELNRKDASATGAAADCTSFSMIKYFLDLFAAKPALQIEYLHLIFEDFQLISQLKPASTNGYEDSNSQFLLATWCRLLPIGISMFPAKICSVSRNIFGQLLPPTVENPSSSQIVSTTTQNETNRKIDEISETINHLKSLLHRFRAKFATLPNFETKSAHMALISRILGPFVNESRATISAASATSLKLLQAIFTLSAHMVNIAANQLYVVGKADCPLAIMLEYLLATPPNQNNNNNYQHHLMHEDCFALIFAGLCRHLPSCVDGGDPYLERKLRQLISLALPHFCRTNSFEQIKSIFMRENLYEHHWRIALTSTIERIYLAQRDQPIAKPTYDYLHRFITGGELGGDAGETLLRLSAGLVSGNSVSTSSAILFTDPSGKDLRAALWQTIANCAIRTCNESHELSKQYIDRILIPFVERNLATRPGKCFDVLKQRLLPRDAHRTCSTLFHQLCAALHRLLDDIERRSLAGNHIVLRKILKDFIINYEQSAGS